MLSMSVIVRLKCLLLALMYVPMIKFKSVKSQSSIIPQDLQLTLIELESEQMLLQKIVPLNVLSQIRNITLVSGNSYEINCNHLRGGFGEAKNIWYFNDTPVTVQQELPNTARSTPLNNVHAIKVDINNWKLVLQRLQAMDSGVYSCRGHNSSVSLDIRPGNPTVLSSTSKLSLRRGTQQSSRPTLIAFVSGNPQPTGSDITWYFNNQSLPSSIIQDGNELLLPSNIKFDLAGRYTCQVSTSAGTTSDDFLVTVIRQPDVVLSPTIGRLVVVSDDAAILNCSDSIGVPTPSFNWTYADNPINRIIPDDRIMILEINSTNRRSSSSVLIIDPVLSCDSGWYTCTAFNEAGHSFQRIYFEIQFKPNLKPYLSSEPVRAILGSNATLQALLLDANPMDVTVRWLGPSGDLIPESQCQYSSFNSSNGSVHVLTLTVTPSSGGVYRCEVENSIGASSVNFTLLVIAPPNLIHTDGSKEVRRVITRNRGAQVTLIVYQFGSMPPVVDADVFWYKTKFDHETNLKMENSMKYNIMDSDNLSQTNLTILSPSFEDSCLYTVTINHEAGAVSLSFQLEVVDPPSPPIMLNATPMAPCVIEVKWTLPDHPPNNTAAPAYIIVEVSLPDSSEWIEIGRSLVYVTKSKANFPLQGDLNGTSGENEFHLRARSGNDTGNIGVGEYYTENATFSFFYEVSDPPTGLRELETSNQTTILQWTAQGPYNCAIQNEVRPSTCSSISYLVTCQLVMEPTMVVMPNELVGVEVPGDDTYATIALKRGGRYKCSVQDLNRCQLLSNHSNSIEVYVPADEVTLTVKTNTALIIGILFTIAAILFLSIVALGCALISQHMYRSKATLPSPATPPLPTIPDSPTIHDSPHTDHDEEVITYSTLKELCIQLTDFREGLPTGDWDQEGQ